MVKTLGFFVFQWVLITLTCYRIQRLVTTDTIYPALAFRRYLDRKSSPTRGQSGFHFWNEVNELFTCPHCMGVWISSAFYFIASYWHHLTLPYTALQAVATMGVISVIADHGHDGE